MKTRKWIVLSVSVAALFALMAQAQQPSDADKAKAKSRTGTTPKGISWNSPPLPAGPIPFDTGVERGLKLTVLKGLVQPWSMAFLPDGGILITERPGRLRIVRNGVLQPAAIAGTPAVRAQGLVGLMEIALHPKFAENKLIYFTYNKPASDGSNSAVITLGRGRWDGTAITGFQDLF